MQRKIVQDDRVEIVPPGDIGHCRAGRPVEDFKWPRTQEQQVCGEWRARESAASAPVAPETVVAEPPPEPNRMRRAK